MNWKIKAVIALFLVGAVAGGALLVNKRRSQPGLTLTLSIAVTPTEKSDFVIAEANSARFKYLVGKKAGVKPLLAQKLSVTREAKSSLVQARLNVLNQSEAQRYVEAFLETLQGQCAGQAQVTLAEQSVR
jgi:uncharacterized membrane protein